MGNSLYSFMDYYLSYLMKVLERVSNLGGIFDWSVIDGEFEVFDKITNRKYKFSISENSRKIDDIEDLDYDISYYEREKEEREKRSNLISEALAKLTKEEIDALGIQRII